MRETVDALIRAGVRIDYMSLDMLDCGDVSGALIGAIYAADEQVIVLPTALIRDTRASFEGARFPPDSPVRPQVDATLRRIEQRGAGAA